MLKAVSAATGLLLAAAALPPADGAARAAARRFPPLAHPFQDSNWGGYVAQGRFTSVIGSWIEPRVTCRTTADLFAPWVGIDGYGSQTVEQTGVQTDCSAGRPVLTAWYEMYPAPPVYWRDPVSEGDSITASVITDGAGRYTLTLTDSTKGWTEHVGQTLGAQDVSAEAVMESPTQAYPAFDRLQFTSVSVNGQVFDLTAPKALTSGGYVPGPLRLGTFAMLPGAAPVPRPLPMRPRVIRYRAAAEAGLPTGSGGRNTVARVVRTPAPLISRGLAASSAASAPDRSVALAAARSVPGCARPPGRGPGLAADGYQRRSAIRRRLTSVR